MANGSPSPQSKQITDAIARADQREAQQRQLVELLQLSRTRTAAPRSRGRATDRPSLRERQLMDVWEQLQHMYGDDERDLGNDGDEFARRVAGHITTFRERLLEDADFPSDLADDLTREFVQSLLWPAQADTEDDG